MNTTPLHTSAEPSTVTATSTDRRRGEHRRRAVDVIARRQTYSDLVYLLLGLPLGTVWFVVLVTGYAVAGSLVLLALIGIPMLLALGYVVRVFANVERGLANTLLGCEIAMAPSGSHTRGSMWTRLRAMTADPDRRRETGFLLLRFPIGIATFTAAMTAISVPLIVAYAPIGSRYVENSYGDWFWSDELHGFTSGSPWSWTLVPAGALMLLGSLHLTNALAAACGRWTTTRLRIDR